MRMDLICNGINNIHVGVDSSSTQEQILQKLG